MSDGVERFDVADRFRSKHFPLIFERGSPGRRAARPPLTEGAPMADLLGEEALREVPPRLPEVAELDLVRHYTQLAHRQFSIDGNVYPLGSCTMKYNPKLHEDAAERFLDLHPYQDPDHAQGVLELLHGCSGTWPPSRAWTRSACSRRPAPTVSSPAS
jgi:glycine dehydrogenase subunit 2